MIQKRHIILSLILVVALNLTFTVTQAIDWNYVETWNFSINHQWNPVETWSFTLSSKGWNLVEFWNFRINNGWNNVETCSFSLANEILSWNHTDVETTSITAFRGWLPILTPVLILIFALTILMVIYTKKRGKQK